MTYRIFEGVRRARAAYHLGIKTVRAQVMDHETGHLGPVVEIAIENLRCPYKENIELGSPRGAFKWRRALESIAANDYDPVLVESGAEGVKVEDVTIE